MGPALGNDQFHQVGHPGRADATRHEAKDLHQKVADRSHMTDGQGPGLHQVVAHGGLYQDLKQCHFIFEVKVDRGLA